jgi:DNA replication protein DnaC
MDNYTEKLKKAGLLIPELIPEVKIENAKKTFMDALMYFLSLQKKEMTYFDEYDKIVDWLSDNKNKGLILMGSCGVGKSFISRFVLPAIMFEKKKIILRVYDKININIDDILTKKYAVLDDIGTEEVSNTFGNKRLALAEIVDEAEKKGNLLIISTNLNAEQIKEKYGLRVYDRLLAICDSVAFNSKSLR